MKNTVSIVLGLASFWVLSSCNQSTFAQIGSGVGGIDSGIGSGGIGRSGIRGPGSGISGPRSGLGVGNSPIANPSPSLTPSQILNPSGSINSGQVLNPEGSINRPRTGVGNARVKTGPIARFGFSSPSAGSSTRLGGGESNSGAKAADAVELTSYVRRLQADATLLEDDLAENPDDGSIERLRLNRLQEILADQSDFNSAGELKELQSVLTRLEAVGNDTDTAISDLPTLKATTNSLRELIGAINQYLRHELVRRLQQLNTTLGRYRNGEHWSTYFRLNDSVKPDFGKWDALAKRFDRVASSPEFQKVASIQEFRSARAALQEYLSTQ